MALVGVWLIATVAFGCLFLLPGEPARMALGRQASSEAVAQFREQAGLDLPLPVQYGRYLKSLAKADFGRSLAHRRPVADLLRERAGSTFRLACLATLVVALLSFALPLLQRLLGLQRLLRATHSVLAWLAACPSYLLGVVAVLLASGMLGWAPVVFDASSPSAWILPTLVLAAYPTALVMRLFDDNLTRELRRPYCRRARTAGFSEARILLAEATPNAAPVALGGLANSMAYFVTGSFFVEAVFDIPGLGRLAQESIGSKDIPVLAPLCLAFAVALTAVSIVLDIAQSVLDPKIRTERES